MSVRRDPNRQQRVLETIDLLAPEATLPRIVSVYSDRVGGLPKDHYDAVATCLTVLKRAGRVQSENRVWHRVSAVHEQPATRIPAGRQSSATREIQAAAVLEVVLDELEIDLADLIARSAFWAPRPRSLEPSYRARRKRGAEKRGIAPDGVRMDDNSFANRAIKSALAPTKFVGFEAAHIWPGTCYDERYHTLVANLVLLPRPIAGLSDHHPHVRKCLQYRAYELFGWHPDSEPAPTRPERYPVVWRYGDLHPIDAA